MLPLPENLGLSLADVLPNCFASLTGKTGRLNFPQAKRVVVMLVDGLGYRQLLGHAGHARTLASRLSHDEPIFSGFPTTTVAGLASLATGELSGEHGLVGYTVLDQKNDRVVNQLSGWEGIDPMRWQRSPTLFERNTGVRSVAITHARYRNSPFTRAVLRGAEFVGAKNSRQRLAELRQTLNDPRPMLIYYYVSKLDVIGHNKGVASAAWVAALEAVDAEVREVVSLIGANDALLVAADHGMVDVPPSAQRIVSAGLLGGVRHVAGEPRCLQLHLEAGVSADEIAGRWQKTEGEHAWVASRDQAIKDGWFGSVAAEVIPRIGQVLIFAKGNTAYYTAESEKSRNMVGQHGSLTLEETQIPLLRFGAFS